MKSLSRILAGTSLALALLGSVDVNTLAACTTTTTTTTETTTYPDGRTVTTTTTTTTKSGSDC
jgi:hypothetical protein